jgi:hypothetical protein
MAKEKSLVTTKGMISKQGQLRTAGRKSSNVSKKGASGVYGAHPSPALSSYKQSMGKDTIPIKFAETGIGTANMNKNSMRRDRKEVITVQKPGSSTIMKTKNRYRRERVG